MITSQTMWKILFFAPWVVILLVNTPVHAQVSITDEPPSWRRVHPDTNKNVPEWTTPVAANWHFIIINRLMGGTYTLKKPFIRIWSNISDEDRIMCSRCNGSFSTIIDEEIWLTDDSDLDDMITMIIMYYQINTRGMSDAMLYSSLAKGERRFFKQKWHEAMASRLPPSNPQIP